MSSVYRGKKYEEDIQAARSKFPYIVQRLSYEILEFELANWISENVGDRMILISKERQGSAVPFSPVLIAYGFEDEADATAFSLKFGKI